jgi:hypothetical protein
LKLYLAIHDPELTKNWLSRVYIAQASLADAIKMGLRWLAAEILDAHKIYGLNLDSRHCTNHLNKFEMKYLE